jgi:hypothetical protein
LAQWTTVPGLRRLRREALHFWLAWFAARLVAARVPCAASADDPAGTTTRATTVAKLRVSCLSIEGLRRRNGRASIANALHPMSRDLDPW